MIYRKCDAKEAARIIGFFHEKFGIPAEAFSGHVLWTDGKGGIFIGPENPLGWERVFSIGLPVCKIGKEIEPSEAFFGLFRRY